MQEDTKDIKIVEIVSLMSIGAFIMSYTHVFGLSLAFHISLFKYLSINDYINTSLGWLPFICIGIIVNIILANVSVKKASYFFNNKELPGISSFSRRKLFGIIINICVLIIFLTIGYLFLRLSKWLIIFEFIAVGTYIWIMIFFLYEKDSKLTKTWNKQMRFLIMVFPPLVMIPFGHGLFKGKEILLNPSKNIGQAKIALIDDNISIDVKIVFILEKCLLFVENHEPYNLQSIPMSRVKSIKHLEHDPFIW
ncbi:MAG: hypothetical protein HYV59_14890 [Planctomycetes bacterium]|nr:hypothetical protein [Planctomycetota bacterium]